MLLAIVAGAGILGFMPIPGTPLEIGKVLLLRWGLLAWIGCYLFKSRWLKAWAVWMVFLLAFQPHTFVIFGKNVLLKNTQFAYGQFNTIFTCLVVYQLLVDRLTPKHINKIFNGIAVIGLIHCLWCWLQAFDIWWIYKVMDGYKGGFSFNQTGSWAYIPGMVREHCAAGALIAFSVPAFLRRGWRKFLPFLVATIILPRNMTAIIAMCAGLGVYWWVRVPRHRLAILGAITALFGVYFLFLEKDNPHLMTASGRVPAWKAMFKFISQHPIKGYGLGAFNVMFHKIDRAFLRPDMTRNWFRAHNEFLELWANQGLIGLSLFCGFLAAHFRQFFRKVTDQGFLAFIGLIIVFVDSLAYFPLHTSLAVIAVIYMAIMVNTTTKEVTHEDEEVSGGISGDVFDDRQRLSSLGCSTKGF